LFLVKVVCWSTLDGLLGVCEDNSEGLASGLGVLTVSVSLDKTASAFKGHKPKP
jgi:hypothetical protein